ncbi:MAG TPA: GAF domain-containing sensor histidine kinase [Gemmatimonadaceae bacterium]|nr:GAF domain-containing sensor histidine kinase [Gemmatimonadaceae bacterium]
MSSSPDVTFASAGSFDRFMEHLPAAFAVTHGEQHTLVFANAAFRKMVTLDGTLATGQPIGALFATSEREELIALMDRAFLSGVVSRNRALEPAGDGVLPLRCTVWPDVDGSGMTQQLLVELRVATQDEQKLGLQRRVAERLLLSAMRDQDAAASANASWTGAAFLAAEGRRLTDSLDEALTLSAMKRMSLPRLGAWCIVDTMDDDETMHRLAISHPDSQMQALLDSLDGRWQPMLDDGFGLPAALRSGGATIVVDYTEAALASAVRNPEVLAALRAVGAGALLTVPLLIRERLIGALTFVGDAHGGSVTAEDIALAEDLASRSAVALDRARLHGEAVASRGRAESASKAKSAFLGMMSHELRTPLNAIGGYVDLIDLELRGPVTAAQHSDLARIRVSQRYLLGLINDLLNLTKVGNEHVAYNLADFNAAEVLAACISMLEPLFAQKQLHFDGVFGDVSIVARGDREKVKQILVNLLSNAIKFTKVEGHLRIDAAETAEVVTVTVSDTGMGIAEDKLDAIFEPFVQLNGGLTGRSDGAGLGLAISRDLARAMGGNLSAVSVEGEGSSFALTLPRAAWPADILTDAVADAGEGTEDESGRVRSPSKRVRDGSLPVERDARDADAG